MTGSWIARIARALLSEETFDHTIAPSISDLQLESQGGHLLRCQHYLGIMIVLLHALLQDLRSEVRFACNAEAGRTAWRRSAVWYTSFVVFLTIIAVRYDIHQDLSVHWRTALIAKGLDALLVAVCPAMLAAALYLRRRSCSQRAIVLVTLMIATLVMAFALAVRPLQMQAYQTLADSVVSSTTPRVVFYSEYLDANTTWWRGIQSGVSIFPFAWLGIILSRRRGWDVALGIAAYLASWMLVIFFIFFEGLNPISPPSAVTQRWRDIALSFVAISIVYVVDRIHKRLWGPAEQPVKMS